MKSKVMGELFAAVAVISLAACGGGGGGAPVASTPAPSPVGAPAPAPAPTPTPAPAPATSSADLVISVSAATYAAGTTEKGAYDKLNAQRSQCGFGLLQQDTRLDVASFNHAHYLVQNSFLNNETTIGHFEDPTRQFFTGNSPSIRATFAGFPSPVIENYTANATSFTTNFPVQYVASESLGAGKMSELIESIYHGRASFGAGRSVGFGSEIGFQASTQVGYNITQFRVVNEISNETNKQVLGTNGIATFPCQGAVVTGVFYPAVESPNPFPAVTSATVAYGTPIYLKADAGATIVVTSATLTRSDGTVISLAPTITSAMDVNKEVTTNEAFMVPTASLSKASTFAFHAVGTVNGLAFTKSFSFSTEP